VINAILIFQTAHRVHGSKAQKFTEYVDNPVDKHHSRSKPSTGVSELPQFRAPQVLIYQPATNVLCFLTRQSIDAAKSIVVVKLETKRKKGHVPEEHVYRLAIP
jgi:hypothetical protein